MRILGIETSCDETGVAIYDEKKGLLSNQLYSQSNLHQRYGGVVPELASRDHVRKIVPLIQLALAEASIEKKEIDAIAWTAGPGLVTSLLVGATIGRALAFAWNVPAIPIHHMEGHLLSSMIMKKNFPTAPFLALLVSGGHTQLIKAENIGGRYILLGESIDDSAGEAFDKVAKLLGLKYPGGPILSKLAINGNKNRFSFPRPMTKKYSELNFSFSGLKTFAANIIRNNKIDDQTRSDIARAFEDAIVDKLVIKCYRALQQTKLNQLVIGGGVSANYKLREKMLKMIQEIGGKMFFPRPEFCTDNGAMIAYAGLIRSKSGKKTDLNISVYPKWKISDLPIV